MLDPTDAGLQAQFAFEQDGLESLIVLSLFDFEFDSESTTGSDGEFYTGQFAAGVEFDFHYDDLGLLPDEESRLKLLQFTADGVWENITTDLDTSSNRIVGRWNAAPTDRTTLALAFEPLDLPGNPPAVPEPGSLGLGLLALLLISAKRRRLR